MTTLVLPNVLVGRRVAVLAVVELLVNAESDAGGLDDSGGWHGRSKNGLVNRAKLPFMDVGW